MDAFFLELYLNLIKQNVRLVFSFEGAFPEAPLVFNLPIESRIRVEILGVSVI